MGSLEPGERIVPPFSFKLEILALRECCIQINGRETFYILYQV
jgi:hypothetical protein